MELVISKENCETDCTHVLESGTNIHEVLVIKSELKRWFCPRRGRHKNLASRQMDIVQVLILSACERLRIIDE
jgi:hypothetical protein